MNKTVLITWIILMVLTIASALCSNVKGDYIALIIIGFSILKIGGVAFQFMELKKANKVWQYLMVLYLVCFTAAIFIIQALY